MKERAKARVIKTSWHGLLVIASLVEFAIAETKLKRHLAMACAGWHLAAIIKDSK